MKILNLCGCSVKQINKKMKDKKKVKEKEKSGSPFPTSFVNENYIHDEGIDAKCDEKVDTEPPPKRFEPPVVGFFSLVSKIFCLVIQTSSNLIHSL